MASALGPLDGVVVGGYFALVAALTITVSCRARRSAPPLNAAHSFFLAEQAAPWGAVAASFFASNIGSDAIVGLSSAGATVGIAAGFFDFASALAFCALAWVFLPAYRRAAVFSLPQFVECRFGPAARTYLAGVALVLYAVNKTAVALYCGAVILQSVTGLAPLAAVCAILLFTCAFSLSGGLRAVIAVEVLNTALLLVGGLAAMAVCLAAVGGWSGLKAAIGGGSADAVHAGLTPSFVHMHQTGGPYDWTALLLGGPLSIIWYHIGA
jgi:SSS family solute:Na+ symporter